MLEREQKRITPLRIGYLAIAIAILILSYWQSELNFITLFQGSGNIGTYLIAYFPPDFTYWKTYLGDTLVTISMGIWGTLMAAIAAIPLSVLASGNISPVWVVQPTRRFLDAMRAINEIVFALMFVTAVGLGPFAGVMALSVHTTGILGKLFSEAVEAIDPGPVEGIRATGASKIQEIIFGVIPQVIPLWASFALYRFESNVRSAAVVGIVGAGGIGVSLYQSFMSFEYQKVCAILIILVLATGSIDTVSGKLRGWLV
ncbi:phosphonate ABC transporter, permease protein PhnE [Geitlerinema sp. PCC 9228]|uniref:phosphonate ABC transporter, permease protein PhnE n=1 Tax=Geitlerinema sp. PCC 9228 TaxID=111611 RepID=UPI0008F98C69